MSSRSSVRAKLVALACLSAFAAACTSPPVAPTAAQGGPSAALAPRPTTAPLSAPRSAVGPSSCKVAQVYVSSTNDKGWSWALYDERGRWFVENVVGSPTP
jgi:hypothetical protein